MKCVNEKIVCGVVLSMLLSIPAFAQESQAVAVANFGREPLARPSCPDGLVCMPPPGSPSFLPPGCGASTDLHPGAPPAPPPPAAPPPPNGFAGIDIPHSVMVCLGVTQAQYERVFSLKKDLLLKLGPKLSDLAVAEASLPDQMLRPEIDRARVVAMQQQISDLHNAISKLRMDYELELMNIFTPEQRTELRRQLLPLVADGRFPAPEWATIDR